MGTSHITYNANELMIKGSTFFRERNIVYDEKIFEDDELGRKYIVHTLLQLAGTGLY